MSLGSVLVVLAVLLVVVAYLARPFRIARRDAGLDRVIEAWVARVRAEGRREGERPAREPVNYCPQCGHHVGPDDRFCAGCGARLPGGGA
jgi:hypothetical protein